MAVLGVFQESHCSDLESRLKAVRIATQLVATLCKNTEDGEWRWWRIVDGVPPGAVLNHAWLDTERDELVLVFAHESFPSLPDGARIENIRPLITTHRGVGEPPQLR